MSTVQNVRLVFFLVTLTPEGLKDPYVGEFGAILETGHWHGDMPGLTKMLLFLRPVKDVHVRSFASVRNTMPSKPT